MGKHASAGRTIGAGAGRPCHGKLEVMQALAGRVEVGSKRFIRCAELIRLIDRGIGSPGWAVDARRVGGARLAASVGLVTTCARRGGCIGLRGRGRSGRWPRAFGGRQSSGSGAGGSGGGSGGSGSRSSGSSGGTCLADAFGLAPRHRKSGPSRSQRKKAPEKKTMMWGAPTTKQQAATKPSTPALSLRLRLVPPVRSRPRFGTNVP